MKNKRRILAVLLAAALLVVTTGFTAAAAETKADSITFSKTGDAKVRVGYAITRTAVTTPEGLTVKYASSDTSVATVNENGKVVGKSSGKAVITASAGGLKTSYNVTVVKADYAAAKAKAVFDGVTVTVTDKTTPATYSCGFDIPITTFYFMSADNKKLGSISGQAMNAIMNKYRVNNNGAWDAPGNNGDWGKWFAEMYNGYRGLSEGDVKKAESKQFEDFRLEVVRLTNIERKKHGLPELEIDQDAMAYAQIRAEELAIQYSHKRPNGENKEYNGLHMIENIYRSPTTPKSAVDGWMNSSGHRRTMLDDYSDYGNKIGVGFYIDSKGTMYWVQEFVIWDANA